MSDELYSKSWAPNIFANKVVFCTGGAGTICSHQVKALVSLGANAAILGRRADHTAKVAQQIAAVRPGSVVLPLTCDVRSPESLNAAVEQCLAKLGRIDYLIAGAAGNFLSTFDGLSPNAFKSVVDIDLLGSFNTVKACVKPLRESKGRILFISAAFHYTGAALQSHVCAAKAGVDALSAALSIELGPWGITSNVITPGAVEGTEGMARLLIPELTEEAKSKVPLQRFATVQEIADATIFLFSDAGKYINGVELVIDGGHWRNGGNSPGSAFYPQIVLNSPSDAVFGDVKGKKASKL